MEKRARIFLKINIEKLDLVMFFAENSVDYLISMLALIYLGVASTPLKPASAQFELKNQLEDSRSKILIVDKQRLSIVKSVMSNENYGHVIKQLKLLIIIDSSEPINEELVNHPMAPKQILLMNQINSDDCDKSLEQIPYFKTTKNDPLLIVYTSGTTGQPKGAVHSHFSCLGSTMVFRMNPNSIRYLFWYPFGHVSGLFAVLKNVCYSQTIILQSSMNLMQMLSSIEKFQVTKFPIPPSHAVELARSDYDQRYNLKTLKEISFAGAKIPADILNEIKQKYHVNIFEFYGATEMMGSVIQTGNDPPGSVGVPTYHSEMKIIDLKTGQSLPAVKFGEICFRGPPRFVKYFNNEKATNETIDSQGWYHTGDVGYYDENGYLYIEDRIKELIKFQHWTVAPAEIEMFLLTNPAIESVCVVGVKHKTAGELIRVYVQFQKNNRKPLTEEEIIEFTRGKLI